MNPDELAAQRLQRVVHHINAIQRLMNIDVVAILASDPDGRPNIIANPTVEVTELRDLLFKFAIQPYEETRTIP